VVQIEQDLLLSRLMIEIARDDILGPELVPSHATALLGGSRLRTVDARRDQALHASARQDRRGSRPHRLESSAIRPDGPRPLRGPAKVETSWWSGEADIPTFQPSELLATKLRALYQRSKGRDLFDLWLGLTVLQADPEQIVAGFNHYMRDATFSFPELRDNLAAKLAGASFRRDLDALTTHLPAGYDPDTAPDLVMRELGSRLRNSPPAEEIAPLGFVGTEPSHPRG
jgi:hypothetical protein